MIMELKLLSNNAKKFIYWSVVNVGIFFTLYYMFYIAAFLVGLTSRTASQTNVLLLYAFFGLIHISIYLTMAQRLKFGTSTTRLIFSIAIGLGWFLYAIYLYQPRP